MGVGGAVTSITGILVPYMVGIYTPNVSKITCIFIMHLHNPLPTHPVWAHKISRCFFNVLDLTHTRRAHAFRNELFNAGENVYLINCLQFSNYQTQFNKLAFPFMIHFLFHLSFSHRSFASHERKHQQQNDCKVKIEIAFQKAICEVAICNWVQSHYIKMKDHSIGK